MKIDEIPATTKEYWEKRKMKLKKRLPRQSTPAPVEKEVTPEMEAQADPMVMEQLNAMRGNPNLRPMGNKKTMRREKGKAGARLSKTG
jgi:hypothetical protein